MIAMAVEKDWISVAKAADIAGCSEQYIRKELDAHLPKDDDGEPTGDRTDGGRIEGWKANGRAWLVSRASAVALRETLSTRARLHEKTRAARKVARPVKRPAKKSKRKTR